MSGRTVASGNAGLSKTARKNVYRHVVYDRGELLHLIARSVIELDCCLQEQADKFELTTSEIADVRTMID